MTLLCGFYCIAFTEYMLAGKTLLDDTNLYIKVNNNVKIQEIFFSHLDHSQSMIKTSVEQSYIKS